MGPRKLKVVDIAEGAAVLPHVRKDWHARGNSAYIVWDAPTNSIILASKLTSLAAYLNDNLARNQFERVKVSGLYGAAESSSAGYTGGLHKMRFRVTRSNLERAHKDAIQKANELGVSRISLVTECA